MLDDYIGLSEGETCDDEGVGISSHLGGRIVDLNTVLSMSRIVAPDQPSSKTNLSDFMNCEEEDTSE